MGGSPSFVLRTLEKGEGGQSRFCADDNRKKGEGAPSPFVLRTLEKGGGTPYLSTGAELFNEARFFRIGALKSIRLDGNRKLLNSIQTISCQ